MQVDVSPGRGLDRGYEYEPLPLNAPSDYSVGLSGRVGFETLAVDVMRYLLGREARLIGVVEYLGALSCLEGNSFDVLNPLPSRAYAPSAHLLWPTATESCKMLISITSKISASARRA